MLEPISWRGLTFQWDPEQSQYICGRWAVGQPRGKWRGVWSGGALYVAGKSTLESPVAALENVYVELNETLDSYRLEVRALKGKVDLIGGDLDALTKGEPNEQAP